jgi:cytochrome c oxidase assembly protein subunit 15
MRARLRLSRERYFLVAAVALVALTLIDFTGAAVRSPARAWAARTGRSATRTADWSPSSTRTRGSSSAIACSRAWWRSRPRGRALAFFRQPFGRDLAVLGVLLPLGIVGQAVMGGLTVLYGLAPGR